MGFLGDLWASQDRPQYQRDTNGAETFGDGSNKWIDGTIETLQGDGKNDISGVLDAAALNFDEGVGGLSSLADDEPGNTAGPGQSAWIEEPRDGQPDNPGTTGVPVLDDLAALVAVLVPVVGIGAALYLLAPFAELLAAVMGGD